MKKYYLYFLLLISFSGFSQQGNISLDEFEALYFISKHEDVSIEGIPLNIELLNFKEEYESAIKYNDDLILEELKHNSLLSKKVYKWVSIKTIIDIANDIGNSVEYLEFFYKNKHTASLFSNYINNPAQDYGSLSYEVSLSVYYDIISYLTYAESETCLNILSDFYKFQATE